MIYSCIFVKMCSSTIRSRERIYLQDNVNHQNLPQNNLIQFYPINRDQRPVPILRLEESRLWQRRMQARAQAQANDLEEMQS